MSQLAESHPLDYLLREDRLPHVWCPACGVGTALNCYAHALERSGIPLEKAVIVSGIGCAGRGSGYVNIDGFHVTHGRAIAFASGLKMANPELNITIFSGDGDLFAIGGNHIIQAARRNMDLTILCSNNFNYGMTGGQGGPTTPPGAWTTTTPYGNVEPPFNLCYLMASCGATYVARWTALHVRRLTKSIEKALKKKGFNFIEIISQCPPIFGRRNQYREGLDMLQYFQKHAHLQHGIHPKDAPFELGKDFYIGEFVELGDIPTFDERIAVMRETRVRVRKKQ
ncbi:MAG: thiamine pyrophosphate-dependent enzyme [Candidatus Heimdallarchaeota archaeon]